jgi:PadR family transcriptional regulator
MSFTGLPAKELVALRALDSGQEKYGLEIVRESDGGLKRSSIYVFLGRLEQRGLIESRYDIDKDRPGPPRRMYRINGAGEKYLSLVVEMETAIETANQGGNVYA